MTIQEKFMKVLKTGTQYDADHIRDCLEDYLIQRNSRWVNHDFRWDCDDKLHYIYDDECYLFVEDNLITVRSDRQDVESEGLTRRYTINSVQDIKKAYNTFYYMTQEEPREYPEQEEL